MAPRNVFYVNFEQVVSGGSNGNTPTPAPPYTVQIGGTVPSDTYFVHHHVSHRMTITIRRTTISLSDVNFGGAFPTVVSIKGWVVVR